MCTRSSSCCNQPSNPLLKELHAVPAWRVAWKHALTAAYTAFVATSVEDLPIKDDFADLARVLEGLRPPLPQ